MAKKWTDDPTLLSSVAANLTDALAAFPKQLIQADQLVREYKMPLSHIQIIITLSGKELSIGSLSERMGIAKPNITPLVDVLTEKGLVERIRSTADRRIVNVHLTERGQALLEQIRGSIASQIEAWPVAFNRSEIKELNASIAAILRITDAMN